MARDEWLRRILLETGMTAERPSRYQKNGLGFWVDSREIAHFEADGALDLRLTKQVIKAHQAEFAQNPRVELRPPSDWAKLRLRQRPDTAFARHLIALAVTANSPATAREAAKANGSASEREAAIASAAERASDPAKANGTANAGRGGKASGPVEFRSRLARWADKGRWVFAKVPDAYAPEIGGPFGRVPVLATVDGRSWRTSVWHDRKTESWLLAVPAHIRAGKDHGDTVLVTVEIDQARL